MKKVVIVLGLCAVAFVVVHSAHAGLACENAKKFNYEDWVSNYHCALEWLWSL
jgi:hypothetical protein